MPSAIRRELSDFSGDLYRKLRGRGSIVATLCIDIGSRYIKIIESEQRRDGIRLTHAVRFDTPAGAVGTHSISDVAAVAGALRDQVTSNRLTARRAVTCIPGPSTMIKRFRLPLKDIGRLDSFVSTEIDALRSCGPGSLCVDQHVSEIALEEAIEVLVAAARCETVDTYVAAIEQAGLAVDAVDIDYLALENMLAANHGMEASRTVALVHVGARFCALSIQSHGTWRLSGNVAMGVEGGAVDGLAAEIDRALRFYWPESAGDRIDAVLLSGGGATLPGIDDQLAERIGRPVKRVDPFGCVRVDSAGEDADVRRTPTSFAVAAGLAVRALEVP
jgi:type IV pilus assembly protein PilM